MLDKLKEIKDKTSNRSLAIVIKSKYKDLYEWVLSKTDNTFTSFNERVNWLLSPTELMCKHGNRKKYSPKKQEYIFCGGPGVCHCHNESVATRSKKESVFGTEKFLNDRKIKWEEKYGVDNPQKLQFYREKASERTKGKKHSQHQLNSYINEGYDQVIDRVSVSVEPMFDRTEYKGCFRKNLYKWRCKVCSNIFESHVDYGTFPKCEKCFPKTVSSGELEIREFLDSLGIEYITNTKSIISPLEIDIYIPKLKIGIEYNGIYWHSSEKKDQLYHVNKFIECKENDIHLIQIFEDQWKTKKDIIKSRLKSVLQKDTKVFGRKCDIKEIDNRTAKEFITTHHLQGWVVSAVNLGIFFKNDLIGVMTFGPARYKNSESYELLRFCSKGTIVGGAAKALSYFVKFYKPASIISYADRCWSTGNLYRKLGFADITTDPKNVGYFYVKGDKRYHRSSLTKEILIAKGFDGNKTADEILFENSYMKIYNCGNYKFIYRLT